MVLLSPIPGWVTRKIQRVQEHRMKKTDARLQIVTEGEASWAVCNPVFLLRVLVSNERYQDDQAFWLGEEDGRNNFGEARGRVSLVMEETSSRVDQWQHQVSLVATLTCS
jgi:hypothetical protein